MKPSLKTALLATVCTAASTAYFWWYHHLLGLALAPAALGLAALMGAWAFSAALFFRGRALRVATTTIIAVGLAWTLASFAYFRVFGVFLPLDAARANSLSLPAVKLIAGYYDLVPLHLALAALALAVAYAFAGKTAGEAFAVSPLAPNGRGLLPPSSPKKKTAARLAAKVLVQILFFLAVTASSENIKDGLVRGNAAPEEVPRHLGVVGYAFASERAHAQEKAAVTPTASALPSAKTTAEVLAETLDAMTGTRAEGTPAARPGVAPKHVIVYQMESAAAWPLAQEPTPMPFLASLMESAGSVGEYFANGCTTIDAEFAVNCGFLPETHGPVSDLYSRNDYRCLPSLLAERGFTTSLYHAGDIRFWARDLLAPAWGFQSLAFSPEIPERAPDSVVFERVVDDLKAAAGPTYQYVIGMTGHSPHNEHFRAVYKRYYGIDVEPYAGALNATSLGMDVDEETLRLYLGFLKAADDSLRGLYERLAAEGLLDDTVIVIFGDHRYYEPRGGNALAAFLDYNRLPFLIHYPGLASTRLAPVASHMDVAPTLYDLLTGGGVGLPDTFIGSSLLSPGHRDAAVTKCLGRASHYDGRALVAGDLTLGFFQTIGVSGGLTSARTDELRDGLKKVAALSDLLLKRNELGAPETRVDGEIAERIRFDDMTDSDGDGLSDMREQSIGTDENNPDSDGDGFPDGIEAVRGDNPLGPGRWVRE